ncbi:MAG: prepilin peptidase [Chloroflexi bacterium]|nr:prepilin peptidase [Chloroflexota bacterium]
MSILYPVVVALAGLLSGFLINRLSTRLASKRPLLGPLHCTRSPHPLAWWQALPLAGYLAQRGRCSTCGKHLALSYPATELLTAGVFVSLFFLEGFGLRLLFHALYASFLILVLVIDWKHRDIYLSVIATGSLIALAGSALLPEVGIFSALIAAAVAGGFFLIAYLLAKLIFPNVEEPLGAGDVLLALMMGLMLGFPNIVGALLIGPLIAGAATILLLVSRKSKPGDFIPYGVALCAASLLFLINPAPFADALHLPALVAALANIFGNS